MRCTVTMDEVEGKGHLIVASELDVTGARRRDRRRRDSRAPSHAADAGCSFSALIRASASVSVRAELQTS